MQHRVIAQNQANRRHGIAAVLVTGALTVSAAVVSRRSVLARRFIPKMFDANIRPPPFNSVREASKAVNYATMLSGSFFAFVLACASLATGSGSLPELGRVIKASYVKDYSGMEVDDESAAFEEKLSSALKGR